MGQCLPKTKRGKKVKVRKKKPQELTTYQRQWLSNEFVQWTKPIVIGTPPVGRYAHTLCAVGSKIYVFGGYTGAFDNGVYIFDTEELSWSKPTVKGDAPSGRAFHSCAVVGSKIYCFGGFNGSSNLQDLWVLETDDIAWSCPVVSGTPPSPRFEHSMASVGNYLVLFGGGNAQLWLNDISVFDTENLTWTTAPAPTGSIPQGRCATLFESYGKKILLYGGYDGSKRQRLSDTWFYDTETNQWQRIIPDTYGPGGRAAHSGAIVDNNLFLFGGFDGKKKLSELYLFNLDKMQWTMPHVSGALPSARSYHSSCVVDKKIWVFGGHDQSSTRSNEIFVLEKVMPSLVNICISHIVKTKGKVKYNFNILPQDLKEKLEF